MFILVFGRVLQYLPVEFNSKAKLEVLVARLGGACVQNNLGSTQYIIAASAANVRVRVCITHAVQRGSKYYDRIPSSVVACA